MSVSITWNQSGSPVSSVSHGSGGNGDTLPEQEISIEHDGNNPITNCQFFLAAKSDPYSGDFSKSQDLAKLLSWGDGNIANDFGGFQINMDAIGSFPAGKWPTEADKIDSGSGEYHVFYTGHGDSYSNGIVLHQNMSGDMTQMGVIPVNAEASFKCRIQIPTSEGTIGIRQFDQRLRFTFTS